MDKNAAILDYIDTRLSLTRELSDEIRKATIIWYASSSFLEEYDPDLVRDLLILLPNEAFEIFAQRNGRNFVIDDHEIKPPVFVRVKSFEWLKNDFSRRLPIALWLYRHSKLLKYADGTFLDILNHYHDLFQKKIRGMIEQKYLEFRSERHNLRYAVAQRMVQAVRLVKSIVVKLALEIIFLSESKPYPYKTWLFWAVERETTNGSEVLRLANEFWEEEDWNRTILLSDLLVEKIASISVESGFISSDTAYQWWLHLD